MENSKNPSSVCTSQDQYVSYLVEIAKGGFSYDGAQMNFWSFSAIPMGNLIRIAEIKVSL